MLFRARLVKELNESSKLIDKTMVIYAKETDILLWYAYLFGPEDSPFQDGIFKLRIGIPTNYPQSPPTVVFLTKIFHPNIHQETGEVCLDVLKQEWNPSWTIESVVRAIGLMLNQPNADSPLNCDAGNLIRQGDMIGYRSSAQYFTKKNAIRKSDFQRMILEIEQEKKKVE